MPDVLQETSTLNLFLFTESASPFAVKLALRALNAPVQVSTNAFRCAGVAAFDAVPFEVMNALEQSASTIRITVPLIFSSANRTSLTDKDPFGGDP